MNPYYESGGIQLFHGDCREILRALPDESVNCCVTSPPYWGLRDYGVDGQLGLEPTPDEFVSKLTDILREVRRVLGKDGTLWLNLGDSYNNHPGQRKQGVVRNDVAGWKQQTNIGCLTIGSRNVPSLKPKDLIGIPWRVAFALQADGWWLRSDIIWAKPAPMPESVTDRPTRSHEYIFLLTKSEKYYYDADAIKEPSSVNTHQRYANGWGEGVNSRFHQYRDPQYSNKRKTRKMAEPGSGVKNNSSFDAAMAVMPDFRNKRDVWTVNTEPFPDAHFATFPPALILPCVLAGCPVGGTVLDPFSGAGTTALVAKENGRKAIGCELNLDYLEMSARRLSQEVIDFGVPA